MKTQMFFNNETGRRAFVRGKRVFCSWMEGRTPRNRQKAFTPPERPSFAKACYSAKQWVMGARQQDLVMGLV